MQSELKLVSGTSLALNTLMCLESPEGRWEALTILATRLCVHCAVFLPGHLSFYDILITQTLGKRH